MVIAITSPHNPHPLHVCASWGQDDYDAEAGIEIDPEHISDVVDFGASIDAIEELLTLVDHTDTLLVDGFTYTHHAA